MGKKVVIFQHLNIIKKHHLTKVEIEFDLDATEEKIKEAYSNWVWSIVDEHFTWYEKEDV
jgi:hypothetical protein